MLLSIYTVPVSMLILAVLTSIWPLPSLSVNLEPQVWITLKIGMDPSSKDIINNNLAQFHLLSILYALGSVVSTLQIIASKPPNKSMKWV